MVTYPISKEWSIPKISINLIGVSQQHLWQVIFMEMNVK